MLTLGYELGRYKDTSGAYRDEEAARLPSAIVNPVYYIIVRTARLRSHGCQLATDPHSELAIKLAAFNQH